MTETITVAEYHALLAAEGRAKYGAKPVRDPVDGYFASTGEHERWCALKLLRDQGRIANLQRQVPYRLEVNGVRVATYWADFVYTEDDERIVEDWKSGPTRTDYYKLKARMMVACHGVTIRETGRKG